jgi:acetylornithine deacetylase/succinyl-diaminopimelate desuccinylase-like protein
MPNSSNDLPLSTAQRRWYVAARDNISAERLKRLTHALTSIHSPTGAERAACEYLTRHLQSIGFEAQYQPVDEGSGNCIARLRGSGGGASLMLYAPIDTHLDADAAIDVPWVGPELRADMLPQAIDDGDLVIGLGASNPKSMLCTLIEAATAVHRSGAPLKGDLIIATCGGGMPWLASARHHNGISSGVTFMLSHGEKPDCAVIFKPGDEVYYEHPGMCWFRISVRGTLGYAGLPRGIPGFRSSIVPAANVTLALEQWLIDYPNRHESSQVRPEGWISALRSGWPEKPAFPSALTEIYLDVRTNPDQTCASVHEELSAFLRQLAHDDPTLQVECELFATCEASRTNPSHWIVKSARRGWEDRHGRAYPGAPLASGQTDAATICRLGIPLVRVGYPFAVNMPPQFAEGLGGMGVARISDLIGPCQSVIYTIIDTCSRARGELDL